MAEQNEREARRRIAGIKEKKSVFEKMKDWFKNIFQSKDK